MRYWIAFVFLASISLPLTIIAQSSGQTATIVGTITGEDGETLPYATVALEEIEINTVADENGVYKLLIPSNRTFTIVFSYVGMQTYKKTGLRLKADDAIKLDVSLQVIQGPTVYVESFEKREIDALHVEKADLERIPTTDMNLTSLIKYLAPGVTAGTGGELTSQYSVRGGNYDENLVYVNDFEIYRPLLIRSGQQEGLMFPNADMLDYLSFSSGGFKAQYGDKMSSVLDINYRRPYEFEASVGGSLLGGSVYVGGAIYKDSTSKADRVPQRFTYTLGARYKTTAYLLSSLDVQGEYVPQFVDIQGNFIYDVNEKWQVEAIGHYSNSLYQLVPVSRETTTGLFNQALRLSTTFQGQEISNFENFTAGAAVTYLPWAGGRDRAVDESTNESSNLKFKLLASHYQSNENERIDIINNYRLDEIETGLGDENFGEVIGTLAYGETHQFARNYLQFNVTNVRFEGTFMLERHKEIIQEDNSAKNKDNYHWLKWGVGYKNEIIRDQLKEWRRIDSLGFTLPYDVGNLNIPDYIRTSVGLNSHRLSAFIQDTWEHKTEKHQLRTTLGVRASYWTLNNEFIVSPRLQVYYTPRKYQNPVSDSNTVTKDLTFKLAAGLYYQPPFYRELRDLRGEVSTDVLAQKSVHVLGGVVWDFMMFKRKFKFISEAYYKYQWDLIPYDIDNVRIRYYGDNMATGYVAGLDLRLNGELVDNLESWVNLSFLRARESFDGVNHGTRVLNGTKIDTNFFPDAPKATDQLLIFSMYFQDDFPGAPWARMNLAFTVGSGLPFGIPEDNIEFRNSYRFAPYHRIDLGASFGIWDRKMRIKNKYGGSKRRYKAECKHPLRNFRAIWVSVEIFNLMDVRNAASNTWIKDFSNRSYAILTGLTSRRINVRFKIDF